MFNFFTLLPPQITFFDAPSWVLCSCVNTSKYILGREDETWGNAKNIKPDSSIPRIGSAVLTTEGGGHIGIVVSKSGEFITIREGNYIPCRLTERKLNITNKVIRGYKSYD